METQLRLGSDLVPRQRSSGGKDKLGSISKQGDRYLRSLFTTGALAVIRYAKIHGTKHRPWLIGLLAAAPHQGRCNRACQQDRQDGMGDDVKGEKAIGETVALAA